MEPLPLFSLVRTHGPGSRVDKSKPRGLGVIVSQSPDNEGWRYGVKVGECVGDFSREEFIPLGWRIDAVVVHGTADEVMALPAERAVVFVGRGECPR